MTLKLAGRVFSNAVNRKLDVVLQVWIFCQKKVRLHFISMFSINVIATCHVCHNGQQILIMLIGNVIQLCLGCSFLGSKVKPLYILWYVIVKKYFWLTFPGGTIVSRWIFYLSSHKTIIRLRIPVNAVELLNWVFQWSVYLFGEVHWSFDCHYAYLA